MLLLISDISCRKEQFILIGYIYTRLIIVIKGSDVSGRFYWNLDIEEEMVKQSEEKFVEENIVPKTEILAEREVPSNVVSDSLSKDIVEEKSKQEVTDFDIKERKSSSSSSESSDDKDQEEGFDKSEEKKRKSSSSCSDNDEYFEAVGEPEIDLKPTDHYAVPEVVEEREERVVSPVSPIRGPEKDFKRSVSPVQEPEVDLKLESQIVEEPAVTDLDSFYEGSKIQEPEYDIESKPEEKSLQFDREVGAVDPEVTSPESQISLELRETDVDFPTSVETSQSELSEVKVRPPEALFHENIQSQFTSEKLECSEQDPDSEQDPTVIVMKDKSLEMKDEEHPLNKSETPGAKPADEGQSEKPVKDSKKLHVTFAESVIDNERVSDESDTTESESSESDTDSDSSTEGSKYLRDVQTHKEKVYRSSSDSDSEREGAYDVEGARKQEMVTDIDAVDDVITEEVTSFRLPDVETELSSLPDSQTPKLKYKDDRYIVEENVEFLRKSPLSESTQGYAVTDLEKVGFDSGVKNVNEEKPSLLIEGDDNINVPTIDTKSKREATSIDAQIESPSESESSSSNHIDEINVDKKDRFVSENQTREILKENELKSEDTEFVDSNLAIPPGNEIEFKIAKHMDFENVQFIEISKKPAAQTNIDDISEKHVCAEDERKSYGEMSPDEMQVRQSGEIQRKASTSSSESSDTDDGNQTSSKVKDQNNISDKKPVQSKETDIDDVLAEKTMDDSKAQSSSISAIEIKEESCEIKEIQPEIVLLETVTARHSEMKETSLSPKTEEYVKEHLPDELHLSVDDKHVRKDNVAIETPANLDLGAKSLDTKENVAELIAKDDSVEFEDDEKEVFSQPDQYGESLSESTKPDVTYKNQRRPSDSSSSESDENESKAALKDKHLTSEDEGKQRNNENEPVDIKEAEIDKRRSSSSSSSSFETENGESELTESKKQYDLHDESHLDFEMETNRVESFILPDRPKTIDMKERQRKSASKDITSRQSRSSSSSESDDEKESQKVENVSKIPITKGELKSPVKETDVDNVPVKNMSLEDNTDDNIKASSRKSSSSSSSSEDNVKYMPVVETDIDSVLQDPRKTFETDLDAVFEENNKQGMEGPIITEPDDYPVQEEPVDYTIATDSDIGAVRPEYVMEQYHTAIPVESPRDKQDEREIPKDEVYCETTLTVVRRVKVKQTYGSDKTERQPTAIEQNLGKKYDQPKIEDVTETDKQHGKRSRSPSWSLDDDDHPIKRLDSQERFYIEKETAPPAREYINVKTASKLDKCGELKEEYLTQKPYVPKERSTSTSSSSSKSADEGEFRVQEYPEESGIVLV